MNKANLTAYEVVTEENLTDIHSTGWLLRHKKTGARVMRSRMMMRIKYLISHSAHRLRTAQVWHISWSTVYSAVQGNFH